MFKILAPLWKDFDIEELINLGADEFYFWIDFTIWLNKRDNPKAQISLQDVKKFLKLKENYPYIRFFVVLNEAPIDLNQKQIYRLIEKLLKNLSPDAFIVKDFMIIDILKQINPSVRLHLSSLQQVWNKESLDYFITFLGKNLERLIFPRDISWIEIVKIIDSYPWLEFEIFAMNEWCWNVDGICSSLHHSWKTIGVPFICYREYSYNWPLGLKQLILNRTSCKVCSFWRFKNFNNIISFKIVWRWASYEQIKRNVIFLKKVIDFMNLCENEIEYKNFCKLALVKTNKIDRCQHCEFNF